MTSNANEILPSGFRRDDLVRLLTQCLATLGYDRTATALERESGITLLSEPVARLRAGVFAGDWELVENLISSLSLASEASRRGARSLVLHQKYFEFLEAGKAEEALHCLRTELAPLMQQQQEDGHTPSAIPDSTSFAASSLTCSLPGLSAYLMCRDAAELKSRTGWPGAGRASREALLGELARYIPPSLLLPEDRLQTLLLQACMWQNARTNIDPTNIRHSAGRSLLEDCTVSREEVPRETRLVLDRHVDEVWLVVFSHGGALLASASKDSTIVLWDVTHPTMRQRATLSGHTDALCELAWSPDDGHLLTCGQDQLLMLWSTGTGECVQTYRKHTESVVACAWLPSGTHFISAGADKTILLWSVSGDVVQTWSGPRVHDLGVLCSGTALVTIAEREILLCPLEMPQGAAPRICVAQEVSIAESEAPQSLSLSHDSRHVLVNVASQEIHLWDLHEQQLLHRYRGHKQGRFVIRSCFAGSEESLVVSGSEDSQVYVWHRFSEELLHTLPGHSGSVNAVAWCPTGRMFVSASDDHTVRVWSLSG